MNKMKRQLNRKIRQDSSLSSDEISLIHMLCKVCDDFGWTRGVYYRYAAEELKICRSQFYRLVKSLKDKGYIRTEKNDISDMDIFICDNSFVVYADDENMEPVTEYKDYINLNMEVFNGQFYQLKGIEKRILYALTDETVTTNASRKKNGRHLTGKIFRIHSKIYKSFAETFGVKVRTVKEAFKNLKDYISIYYDEEYTGKDIITVKSSLLSKPLIWITEKGNQVQRKKTDNMDGYMECVKMLCRRRNIEADIQSITDTAGLMVQYKNKAQAKGIGITGAIAKAIDAVGSILNAAGVNKYISNFLANAKDMANMVPVAAVDADGGGAAFMPAPVEKGTKNKFNNFNQRNYSKEEWEEIERKLLERSKN